MRRRSRRRPNAITRPVRCPEEALYLDACDPVEPGLTLPTEKRELEEREEAAVAATTVTVTQTTYTVTQTDVTTLPAETTTELIFETSTTTMYVSIPLTPCWPRRVRGANT